MSDTVIKDPFGDDDEADTFAASFAPKKAEQIEPSEVSKAVMKAADSVAETQGFTSRKRTRKKAFRRSDNLRTGRSELISVKGRADDKARISAISDDRQWVNGQTLQYALDALEEKINDPQDKFWETRNFHGVD